MEAYADCGMSMLNHRLAFFELFEAGFFEPVYPYGELTVTLNRSIIATCSHILRMVRLILYHLSQQCRYQSNLSLQNFAYF